MFSQRKQRLNVNLTLGSDTPFGELDTYLVKYQVEDKLPCTVVLTMQTPEEADSLMKVQKDLDETKVILVSSHFCILYVQCIHVT
jgi:hypothetical protein